MRKIKAEFKLLVCLTLVAISAFFVGINTSHVSASVFAANSEQQHNVIVINTTFDDFSNVVMQMAEQYPADENAIVFFDKDGDLCVDDDGNYLVSEETFNQVTGQVINRKQKSAKSSVAVQSDTNCQLNELAAQAGYDVTDDENSVVLTRKFGTKRLMLLSNNPNLDLRGAVSAASYGDMRVHQYETELATSEAYEYYLNCPDVEAVEADGFCWADSSDKYVTVDTDANLSYSTWGAEQMGVPEYSQYLLDAAKTNNSQLPEVVVAVLDTGIDTDHPWFEGRFLTDADGKIIGKNYTSATSQTEYDFEDDQGHGTHCAGIICDMTLPNVKILPIKFMYKNSDGRATGSDFFAKSGIEYAIEQKQNYNIVAINMSFGSSNSFSENFLFKPCISNAYNAGIFSVAAAGNDKKNAIGTSPANIDGAITVSALRSGLVFDSNYSNFGDVINVCAPGTNIVSASFKYHNEAYVNESSYQSQTVPMNGTSMATPHVAAYIALLYSDCFYPYTQDEINQILNGGKADYLVDLGDPGKDIYYGYGMPTLANAIPDSSYTVNYYLESLYDLNSNEPHGYDVQSETLSGEIGSLTAAVAKDFAGFSLVGEVQQKTITPHDKTIIDIYYQRNIYQVTVNIPTNDQGLVSVSVTGNNVDFLFGADVEVLPILNDGYYVYEWELTCNNMAFCKNFDYNALEQKFAMPAASLTLKPHSKLCSYDITVDIVGAGMVSPEKETVNYGDGMTFILEAENGYRLNSVSCNGVDKVFTEMDDGTYRVSLSNITADVKLSVDFVKEDTIFDNLKNWVMHERGGVIISATTFACLFVLLVVAFRVKKHK